MVVSEGIVHVDSDVVVWVTVIWDQGTSIVVSDKFDLVGVDPVHGGEVGLTIVYHYGGFLIVGSGSDLGVDIRANVSVSSDKREFNAVGVVVKRIDVVGILGWAVHLVSDIAVVVKGGVVDVDLDVIA